MQHKHIRKGDIIIWIVLALLLITTFFPFVMMVFMSFKPTVMISNDFLGWRGMTTENYKKAISFVSRPILNSFIACGGSLVFILFNVTLAGWAFARMKFKGKKFFYGIIYLVMMVPTTITIIPQYMVVNSMHLTNTYWALIFPYIASQQIFGIILVRTTFEQMPNEMFEAARIDGANETQQLLRIGLPLIRPALVTVGITAFINMYNDYIWPTIVLTGGDKIKTFCQIVYNTASGFVRTDAGLLTAAFVIGSIPMIVITCFCMKYYLAGMTAGAVKG